MKKISFNIGDKVVTIENGELRKGVIRNIYPMNPPICVIEFEDGTVKKELYSSVAPEPKAETQEEIAPIEKAEITITPDKFKEIACRVIAEETKDRISLGLVIAGIVSKIHKALFVEPWEND